MQVESMQSQPFDLSQSLLSLKTFFPSKHNLTLSIFLQIKFLRMFRKSEAPAAERNKGPILEVLKEIIKIPSEKSNTFPSIKILEVSSGTGQHISHFAKHLPSSIFWQPSEFETRDFSSICAYIQDYKLKNVAPPVFIDIRRHFTNWNLAHGTIQCDAIELKPIDKFEKGSLDYIYNANLIHISPFECTEGLFLNSGELLKKNGCLITYGPYGQNGNEIYHENLVFFKFFGNYCFFFFRSHHTRKQC